MNAVFVAISWNNFLMVNLSLGVLKVSKFQNEFMKLWFLPKYEPKIVKILAL